MATDLHTLKAQLKSAVRATAEELIQCAGEHRRLREKFGQLLSAYQQLFGTSRDIDLPPGISEALAMGRVPGVPRRRRRDASNAVKAAVVLTERGEVLAPLRVRDIHDRLVSSGLGGDRPPTLATLQSTIIRSGLFERAGGGLWRLVQPVERSALGPQQTSLVAQARDSRQRARRAPREPKQKERRAGP